MKNQLESLIRNIPDFPKPGVMFKDISPLMKNHWKEVIQLMSDGIDWTKVDHVIGIESRGFILGSAMAIHHGKGFIPVRKKGKLPPPVLAESYALEYGTDTLEMALNDLPARVLVVDDVLATGGTLNAVINLCKKNKFEITAMSVLINLTFLNKFKEQGLPLYSVFNY